MGVMVDPIAAEARAVEHGAHAIAQDDGSFRVRSASKRGTSYRVTCALMPWAGRFAFKFACECESGSARPSELVPCWHAALVGRRLERIAWATWEHGYWWATDKPLDAAGLVLPKPPAKKIRGRCPECQTFLTIEYADDEKRSPATVASAHDPKCLTEHTRRRVRAAGALQAYERRTGKPLDLWDRK